MTLIDPSLPLTRDRLLHLLQWWSLAQIGHAYGVWMGTLEDILGGRR